MRHIHRFSIIVAISFLGELLNRLIPLPIPGSIYGLVLMFAGLCTGVIPLEAVRQEGHFLINIMPVMFIPAGVGLMESWGVLKGMVVPVLVIMVVSTFVVMGVTGAVTQAAIRREEAKRK
ncbi:MAG: CidA/LrgA family protein [Clostridia bacterium]|nr:CidA/LrgA family protein [Clostridia bacterium]